VGQGVGFKQYFQLATPIDVIEKMRTGQNALADHDDVMASRNIPWAFAWAQSRHLLPSWYGFGTGLSIAISEHGIDTLREMLRGWPFFRRLISDVETALAITDPGIAKHYSELAGEELHEKFFPAINAEFKHSVDSILLLREQKILLEKNDTLRRSIRLRNPYVDPMSLLQVELLRRWRSEGSEDAVLLNALLASVNGISRGLQTSV
jgi:phosphoenolpyruvate carboxylase